MIGKIVTGYWRISSGGRAMWIVSGLLTAVYIPIFVYTAPRRNVAYLLLVFGFLYGAPYAVNGTYMSESFPAAVRGTAVGGAYNIGRIGSTLSPLLIGLAASRYSIGFGLGLLGVSYLACALIPAFFIPERQFDPSAVKASAGPVAKPATLRSA